jgi:hypothetical protein
MRQCAATGSLDHIIGAAKQREGEGEAEDLYPVGWGKGEEALAARATCW